MTTLAAELASLVVDTLRALEDMDTPASEILRRCHRIAVRQNDVLSIAWLEMELTDKAEESKESRVERRAELTAQIDPKVWEIEWHKIVEAYIRRRGLRSRDGMLYGDSVSSIERNLEASRDFIDFLEVPQNMAPLDVALRSREYTDEKFKFRNGMDDFQAIIDRTRLAAHRYLVAVEYKLSIGQLGSDAYERNREYVDRHLADLDGPALEQFQAAYRRSGEGDAESLTHALTSCRRILKSVADSVFPPRREPLALQDGTKVQLGDDKYINRLIQSVKESLGPHGPSKVIEETLTSLYSRLRALDALASKGVHADVTEAEVDVCIVQTYLVVGDVLRYRQGSVISMADIEASIDAETPDPAR